MREAFTYRAARRNECRELKLVWGPHHYFDMHRQTTMRIRERQYQANLTKVAKGEIRPKAAVSKAANPKAPRLRRASRGQ